MAEKRAENWAARKGAPLVVMRAARWADLKVGPTADCLAVKMGARSVSSWAGLMAGWKERPVAAKRAEMKVAHSVEHWAAKKVPPVAVSMAGWLVELTVVLKVIPGAARKAVRTVEHSEIPLAER